MPPAWHWFDRSIGYFWRATHQQIYRTLRAMEDDGWVFATLVVQHGRPDKKVYTVSDTGRAELARWIAEPLTGRGGALSDTRTRDVAVKLRGATYGDPAALRTQISALRAERAQLLDTYRGFEKHSSPTRRRCAAARYINIWCCAAVSAPRKARSIGSTR
jgi:DNA-binding PadR family transcriptional regulator